MKEYKHIIQNSHFIDGKREKGNGKRFEIVNKYTNEVIETINYADSSQLEKAIDSASKSFQNFKKTNAGKRRDLIKNIINQLEKNSEAFTSLIIAEAGKPAAYARLEVQRALVTLNSAAEEAVRLGGEIVPMDFSGGEGKMAFTRRFPVGPVAAISPFNFPLNLAMHKIAPALACGCTIILKPPHQAPLTCLAFAKLVEEAGIPPGVVNVLLCDIPEAEKLVKDDRIKLLSFTGSDKVGWHLKNIAGKKKVLLELGGNAAVLIDETSDLEYIAPVIAKGTYNYAGQVCISTQRIYILENVFEEFKNILIEEIKKLKSGDPADPAVTNGPLIAKEHLNRINDWVNEAVGEGAEILTGGNIIRENNNLYAPTLLTNTNSKMKIISEEVFGPIAAIEKVSSFEEGLKKINDSRFGLQAGIFTQIIERMKMAFNTLDVGGIIINNVPALRMDVMPYGGIKDSGLGREGIKYAIEEMTEPKLIIF